MTQLPDSLVISGVHKMPASFAEKNESSWR
jgi:hypothetical protein